MFNDYLVEHSTLEKAIQYATKMHSGQKRKNSKHDDYIVHPIEVMYILFDHSITDEITLIVAVLHDVVEDTPATLEDIAKLFGSDVATIVDEVTDDKDLPFCFLCNLYCILHLLYPVKSYNNPPNSLLNLNNHYYC